MIIIIRNTYNEFMSPTGANQKLPTLRPCNHDVLFKLATCEKLK